MATRHLYRYLVGLALLLCPLLARGQFHSLAERTACVLQWSERQLPVRELTGRNDGPQIEAWQKAGGGKKGDPWCGFYQRAGNVACGLPVPAGAGAARSWFVDAKRTYYLQGVRGSADQIQPGHQVGFYYASLGRISHVGRAVSPARKRGSRGWYCNEGNTGTGGGREGAGVYLLLRANWEFYAAANWLQ